MKEKQGKLNQRVYLGLGSNREHTDRQSYALYLYEPAQMDGQTTMTLKFPRRFLRHNEFRRKM